MPNPRLTTALKAVQQSSEYLVEQFHARHHVSMKKDDTVLLGEDLTSEEILMSTISKAFPSDTFLTEETVTKNDSEMVWVIDPICGSYSYLRGIDTWSISMALVSGDTYLLGVVAQPLLGNFYHSEKGHGVFRGNEKVVCSEIDQLRDAFVSVEHAVFHSGKYDLMALISKIKRIRVGHGSGSELAYLASGVLDALIKTDQALMHFAGGRALVEEAGGAFIDFSGKRAPTYLDRDKTTDYIACNAKLAKQLLEFVEG